MVVGAGPAGLEAARVLGERGHQVVRARGGRRARRAGAARRAAPRRRDLIGIVDWRVAEAKHAGVEFRYGVFAERRRRAAPRTPTSSWSPPAACPTAPSSPTGSDLVARHLGRDGRASRPRGDVLVYDDNGAEPALDAAELLAARGAEVELVTPERTARPARSAA